MTLSTMQVTGTWVSDTGLPAQGRIEFLPKKNRFTNGGAIIDAHTFAVLLDAAGHMSVVLARCSAGYQITENIIGAPRLRYTLKDDAGPVDLGDTDLLVGGVITTLTGEPIIARPGYRLQVD